VLEQGALLVPICEYGADARRRKGASALADHGPARNDSGRVLDVLRRRQVIGNLGSTIAN